ncbi:hypothetical protein HNY73_020015 [Argiope bruennichi]|uniref:Uncharacterized protein n=1 Tax=Argiope bruennichi TaxID=94029 RepID=A0A8T0E5G3_ARGBR|nr:hypothetical protein HNY73_020015 [Argiope bruennichi]
MTSDTSLTQSLPTRGPKTSDTSLTHYPDAAPRRQTLHSLITHTRPQDVRHFTHSLPTRLQDDARHLTHSLTHYPHTSPKTTLDTSLIPHRRLPRRRQTPHSLIIQTARRRRQIPHSLITHTRPQTNPSDTNPHYPCTLL